MRVSGLFTIASNILAALAAAVYTMSLRLELLGQELRDNFSVAIWVIVASGLLYCAGMLWNDVADADRDRVLHPRRPLPSGAIQLSTAYVGGLLLASGALLAATNRTDQGKRGSHNTVGQASHHITATGGHFVDTNGELQTFILDAL